MIIWCSFALMLIRLCHGSGDSMSSISYELDQAALEIMRQYDIAEDVRRSNLRRILQHGFRHCMKILQNLIPIRAMPTQLVQHCNLH